jgi:NodT family efflux transporter outer membrane factor (OMF) lipoprotein
MVLLLRSGTQWIVNRAVVLALLATSVGGCVLGPDFQQPLAPAVDTYVPAASSGSREAPSIIYGEVVAADWYALFQSDALNALVRAALANNPNLEAARHRLAAAQAELRAVTGSTAPQLNVGAGASRARINGSFLYGPADSFAASGAQYSVGPTLAYTLDLFGSAHRSIEAQSAVADNVRYEAQNTYITLVGQVVMTAFDYAAADAQLKVTREIVDNLRDQLDLTRRLEAVGKITRSDTLLAQTQLETTAATLPELERRRLAFANALAELVGATPSQFAVPPLALDDFRLPQSVPMSLPSALVRQRPDVLAAEGSLHQASAEIGVARAARFPSLTLSAQFSKEMGTLSEFPTSAANVWSLGLNLVAPILHGGSLAAREDAARSRYAQAAATYRSSVLGAFHEVADSLQALELDAAGHAAYRRALDSAQANSDLVRAQFQAGSVNQLQVLTVQQQYHSAALAEVQARAKRFADVASLMRALGGGWWNGPADPARAEYHPHD